MIFNQARLAMSGKPRCVLRPARAARLLPRAPPHTATAARIWPDGAPSRTCDSRGARQADQEFDCSRSGSVGSGRSRGVVKRVQGRLGTSRGKAGPGRTYRYSDRAMGGSFAQTPEVHLCA